MSKKEDGIQSHNYETRKSSGAGTAKPEDMGSVFDEQTSENIKVSVNEENESSLPVSSKQTSKVAKGSNHNPRIVLTSTGDLQNLPRLLIGLPVCLVLTLVMMRISNLFSSGLSNELWVHLPLQIYWTLCLYRLSKVMGQIYKSTPPMSALQIGLLSIVSFVCMPTFDVYNFSPRWLDPFFLCWVLTQMTWPFVFAHYSESKSKAKAMRPWRLPLVLTIGVNAYLLVGCFVPGLFNLSIVFSLLWFFSQFGCIAILKQKLIDEFAGRPLYKLNKGSVKAGKDIVVRYRPFVAIERWIKERLSAHTMKKGMRLILMWLIAPLMLIGTVVGLIYYMSVYSVVPWAVQTATVAPAVAVANSSFMSVFLVSILGFWGAVIGYYLSKPSHIGLSSEGFRFLWRHKVFSKNGHYVPWSQLAHVSVLRPTGKTSPLDDKLTFVAASGKKIQLTLGSIDTVDDRESLLKAIQKWAPNASRDPSVIEALQPPSDYSYTELWLQALSAPPKREWLQPLISGAVLHNGNYRVLYSLGVGGQGQAYLAEDNIKQQKVVLKEFILPVYVDINVRRGALEQFENEAQILRQLNHPQIVKLIEFFVEDHRAYLVLEHIQGASLREIVTHKGKLPESQVKMLALQMCSILEYLHGLVPPIVHRDFTPDNLVLNVDGTLKLIDFNVAKQVIESTTSGTVVGKHAYLPPEQFRGMPEIRSDIYAMGGTLYYLLTGTDPEPIMVSHPSCTNSEVSEGFNKIVEQATALVLENRYPSAQALQKDLDAI